MPQDDVPVWDVAYYRHTNTTSAKLYYGPFVHGQDEGAITVTDEDTFAIPFQTGHGGTITGGLLRINAPDSHHYIRLAFYACTNSRDRYPGTLIADLGSIQCGSALTVWSTTALPTSAHDLWWLTYQVNTNTAFLGMSPSNAPLVYGRLRTDLGTGAPVLRYQNLPYTSCWVGTFPQSATTFNANALPRIMVGY
jgi:hypothetical protein